MNIEHDVWNKINECQFLGVELTYINSCEQRRLIRDMFDEIAVKTPDYYLTVIKTDYLTEMI